MAIGRRNKVQQQELFVATDCLPSSNWHVFYSKLNKLLAEADFDTWIESQCEPHYKAKGFRQACTFECVSLGTSKAFNPSEESLGDVPIACRFASSSESR